MHVRTSIIPNKNEREKDIVQESKCQGGGAWEIRKKNETYIIGENRADAYAHQNYNEHERKGEERSYCTIVSEYMKNWKETKHRNEMTRT